MERCEPLVQSIKKETKSEIGKNIPFFLFFVPGSDYGKE